MAADLLPPASLTHARQLRDDLVELLSRERDATADFLLALADFDQRRGWEPLGHASLFAFLHRELGLSKGAAYLRFSTARLLPRFPEVEAGLRRGQLCLSAVGELAKVLTLENRADVLPRFFGCSSREAREVAAALAPKAEPPRRDVVTLVPVNPPTSPDRRSEAPSTRADASKAAGGAQAPSAAPPVVRAHELAPTHAARALPLDDTEPLDADLRRLHVTVSRRLLEKLDQARDGRSHTLPCATTEQVLEAALDLLLGHQARRKSLVKRPRATPPPTSTSANARPHVPAAIERAVRLRDGDRCQFPLDTGGICGSTTRIELDHVVPVAQGGPTSAANLRCLCAPHNRFAARLALGEAAMSAARRRATLRASATACAADGDADRSRARLDPPRPS